MVGECGTGKSGTKYFYYNCLEKKKNRNCKKKAVQKQWIEQLVLEKAKAIVMSDEMIDFIAEKTYQYYMEQNTETSYTDVLHGELKQVETAIANLVRALEAGIFNAATKARMDELEQQKESLKTALADAELISGLRLTREHIKFFLLQFRSIDFDEPESQRRIIDIFINAVFVYDDRVTITFNYSGDNRTITLAEVDGAAEGVRAPSASGHQNERGSILEQIFWTVSKFGPRFFRQSIDMTGSFNEQGCERKSGHLICKQVKIRFATAKNQKFEPSIPLMEFLSF